MAQAENWIKLGFEDPNQQDGNVEYISMKLRGKRKVFHVNRITQPMPDVQYFFIQKTSIMKSGNCFDPPGDDFEWDATTHMQLFLKLLSNRRFLGHKTLKQDPKNTGKSSKFQYGHKQKVKRFDCKFKKKISCPAIKWVSVGEPVQFVDKIKQKKDRYKLFSVTYENEHNHRLISEELKGDDNIENLERKESSHENTKINDINSDIDDVNMSINTLDISSNDVREQMEENMSQINIEKNNKMQSEPEPKNRVFIQEDMHCDSQELLLDVLELEEAIEPTESLENSILDSRKEAFVEQIGLTPKEDFKMSKNVQHTDRDHRKLRLIDSSNDKYKHLNTCCKTHIQNLEKDKILKNLIGRHVYRWFTTRHLESCWINSCLQLMTCLFDYIKGQDTKGKSQLWKKLWQLKQKKGKLNPLPIRTLLFEKELERITQQNIMQSSRLFHFAESDTTLPEELAKMTDTQRLEQQDCQDFFKCLLYNYMSWPDVCSPFTATKLHFIYCPICKTVSPQKDLDSAQSYILLDAPKKDMQMDDLVNDYFNAPHEKVWTHDKDGCGAKTYGQGFQRLKNIYQQEFLIFIVNRSTKSNTNKLNINKAKIEITPTIDIVECKNEYSTNSEISIKFKPIALIHQKDNTIGSDTRGQYMADILDYTSTKWVRTSDDAPPKEINFSDVSNQGYILLYKNTHEYTKTRKLKPRRNN